MMEINRQPSTMDEWIESVKRNDDLQHCIAYARYDKNAHNFVFPYTLYFALKDFSGIRQHKKFTFVFTFTPIHD
jgi:hypothetical protein